MKAITLIAGDDTARSVRDLPSWARHGQRNSMILPVDDDGRAHKPDCTCWAIRRRKSSKATTFVIAMVGNTLSNRCR